MELFEGLLTRRSVRKYSGEKINPEDIIGLVKAGMYAPSANNRRPWHFIIVDDRKIMDGIMENHPYSSMLKEASHAIVVCGNKDLQPGAMYYPLDCSAATQNILLAAHSKGYGAVWLGVYPREERIMPVSRLLGLPGNIVPVSIISVGIPAGARNDQPDRFEKEKISYNGWKS
ncbi:MAG TPA: nitroreductase family protein [Bacteroidales bacterium]|nr:nitroreductase family protein [Bacteroidales bacterium]